jgi:hypothetical protein
MHSPEPSNVSVGPGPWCEYMPTSSISSHGSQVTVNKAVVPSELSNIRQSIRADPLVVTAYDIVKYGDSVIRHHLRSIRSCEVLIKHIATLINCSYCVHCHMCVPHSGLCVQCVYPVCAATELQRIREHKRRSHTCTPLRGRSALREDISTRSNGTEANTDGTATCLLGTAEPLR